MRKHAQISVAAVLACGTGVALAQSGDLSTVTMRVLDDLRDVDAVILALDAGAETAEPAEREGREAAEGGREAPGEAADERRSLRRERDRLHDPDIDERSEGRLEDRDVERRTDPPADAP
jgi:hypothetical protein